jgi:hypothetical protein
VARRRQAVDLDRDRDAGEQPRALRRQCDAGRRAGTLQQLRIDPRAFAEALLQRAAAEQESIAEARAKVRAKGEWGA